MAFNIQSILGKPLSEMSDEELKAKLFELKQQRLSKQQAKIKSKAKEKKTKEPSENLIKAALAEAMRRVGK